MGPLKKFRIGDRGGGKSEEKAGKSEKLRGRIKEKKSKENIPIRNPKKQSKEKKIRIMKNGSGGEDGEGPVSNH